jgi:hypothetical protein
MTRVGITCKNVLKLQPDRQHGWQRTSMHKKQHSQSEPVSRFTTFVCCTGVNAGGKKLWGVVENRFCSGALVLHAVYQACLGRLAVCWLDPDQVAHCSVSKTLCQHCLLQCLCQGDLPIQQQTPICVYGYSPNTRIQPLRPCFLGLGLKAGRSMLISC